jgi:serine/threonine protein kinase
MGTTQYLAPERIDGGPGTPASDLYALGIVLHECLTGVPPYDGTAAEVMAAHRNVPLPPLPAFVPPELATLVARLTAKDPAARISDAGDLAALAARLRGDLTVAADPAAGNPVPHRRRPVARTLGAAGRALRRGAGSVRRVWRPDAYDRYRDDQLSDRGGIHGGQGQCGVEG